MPLVLGIDEAGYGPTLGPLLVCASLWRVEPQQIGCSFWKALSDAVVKKPRRGDWRIVVDDSKTVFDRSIGIGTLERSVLAFARAAGLPTGSLADLLAALGADDLHAGPMPWYRELRLELPLDRARVASAAIAERLCECLNEARVACLGLRAAVVTEDQFNTRVSSTRNKAELVVEQVLRHIAWAAGRCGSNDLHVLVDRLGGRTDYRQLLGLAFPDRHVHVLEVADSVSRYRLGAAASDWFIEFRVDGDQRHLPIALASMLAKYVREALMDRFNDFWRRWMPEIAPTAGYSTDAARFLSDLQPVVKSAGVPRELFVRSR
jgi:ribonuclease HII